MPCILQLDLHARSQDCFNAVKQVAATSINHDDHQAAPDRRKTLLNAVAEKSAQPSTEYSTNRVHQAMKRANN